MPQPSPSRTERRSIFGIEFTPLGAGAIVNRIVDDPIPHGAGPRLLLTANLDHIVHLTRNIAFAKAYRNAWLAVIDGTPVLLYARLRGIGVRSRVTGADLFPAILSRLRPGEHRVGLICASETTATLLRRKLSDLGLDDHLVVTAPPSFETDQAFGRQIIRQLHEQRITHLFMGIGAPKSEIWMDQHRAELPDCYGFGFGAGLDFLAGTKRRAPRVLRILGLEFLWRVASEPRRLAKRYFISSWTFLHAVAQDLTGRPLVGK